MCSKQNVIVKLTKEFRYPKSMLSRDMYVEDAINKARMDLQEEMKERVKNDFKEVDLEFYNVSITETQDFKLREPLKRNKNRRRHLFNADEASREIANAFLLKKYKSLNRDENPDIYDGPYLKPNVEKEYQKKWNEIYEILRLYEDKKIQGLEIIEDEDVEF